MHQIFRINTLQGSFDAMHKHVSKILSDARKKSIESHNQKLKVTETNLEVRCFIDSPVPGQRT